MKAAVHDKIYDLKCNKCDYATNDARHLEGHIKGVHLKVFDYKCKQCEYQTVRQRYLKKHERNVHKNMNAKTLGLTEEQPAYDQNQIKCQLCEFKAESEDALTSHLMSYHVISDYSPN